MPIYEYRCRDCNRRVSILWRSLAEAESTAPRCPKCGGEHLTRLMSRVAVARSEEEYFESLMDPGTLGDLDESDPKSLARWMRRMGQEVGEDLGDEFDEVVGRLEAGQSPDEIEAELPDLGLGASSTDEMPGD